MYKYNKYILLDKYYNNPRLIIRFGSIYHWIYLNQSPMFADVDLNTELYCFGNLLYGGNILINRNKLSERLYGFNL